VTYRRTHWFIPNQKKNNPLLHGQYPELKLIHNTGQLPGPKFCMRYSGCCLWPKFCVTQAAAWDRSSVSVTQVAAWDWSSVSVTQAAAWDWSATLALGKKLPLLKLVLLPPHFQIIPKSSDLLLIFSMFISHVLRQDVLKGLWTWPLWLLSIRSSLSREHVKADKSLTPWQQHFHSKNKAKPNFILEIAKRYVKYLY
jgi:hypothetical protein